MSDKKLIVRRVVCGSLDTNSYVLNNEGCSECIVIDPADAKEIARVLNSAKLDVKLILLTHGHFDHIEGVRDLRKWTEAPLAIHELDNAMLLDNELNMSHFFVGEHVVAGNADVLFHDGDVLDYAGIKLKVIHTPGHSMGGCCFQVADTIITGDTIFRLSAGRTDGYGGDTEALIASIKSLFALDGDYKLYPGHGDVTSMQYERENNTFMKYYASL